ncbi:hypothetical protein ONZ45_g14198 [Pleurotus djamor]|nr:hypothetical protein ONZ45_g14198 [Pleurotus djamor]
MVKNEKEDLLNVLASRLLASMVDDLVLDATIQSHKEIARTRSVCSVCHTRCAAVHVPGQVKSQPTAGPSRAATPMSTDAKPSSENGTKAENSVNLECMNCDRQTSLRMPGSDVGRSASPASEHGNLSDDSKKSSKGKMAAKNKRDEDAEFNLKRKRLTSPQASPTKKQKKKPSGLRFIPFRGEFNLMAVPPGSPVSRLKSNVDLPFSSNLPSTNSISRVPSKLRDSSTASFLEKSPSASSSRSTSPGVASVATIATSSSFSGTGHAHSPSFSGNGLKKPTKKVTGTGPPRRLSPPRAAPVTLPLGYAIDVDGGEETGSSTDTDSS